MSSLTSVTFLKMLFPNTIPFWGTRGLGLQHMNQGDSGEWHNSVHHTKPVQFYHMAYAFGFLSVSLSHGHKDSFLCCIAFHFAVWFDSFKEGLHIIDFSQPIKYPTLPLFCHHPWMLAHWIENCSLKIIFPGNFEDITWLPSKSIVAIKSLIPIWFPSLYRKPIFASWNKISLFSFGNLAKVLLGMQFFFVYFVRYFVLSKIVSFILENFYYPSFHSLFYELVLQMDLFFCIRH